MAGSTPTLRQLRQTNRDYIVSRLGSALIPNSDTRILADTNGANAHLVLQYIDWLALQLLPDTAETQFLDRHGNIWLVNSDASIGRKDATLAQGTVTITGTAGTVFPISSQLTGPGPAGVTYETTASVTVGASPTPVAIRALDPGAAGNAEVGDTLSIATAVAGVDASAIVVELTGGADTENDDDLRGRVLLRIQQPPMGGDATDYEAWALAVPGVTRAWASPLEMGMGTIVLRFMCDELRATGDPMTNGFPLPADIAAVTAYIDLKRPVAIKDRFVLAPTPTPVNLTISHLDPDTMAMHNAIQASISQMIHERAKPGHTINGAGQPAQTIFNAWVSDAILNTPGVFAFDLTMPDAVMPNGGCLAVLGSITWA